MKSEVLFILFSIVFAVFVVLLFNSVYKTRQKREQLERYEYITLGMSEAKMLEIMGNGYNCSLLKNNRKKYEWRINSTSVGYSSNGVSSRMYSGVKKVTIYISNGVVEEVRPYNV